MSNNISYIDNNATTKVDPAVVEAVIPWLSENYFNPSSTYDLAKPARDTLEKSRKVVADFIGANPNEIIFTGSATESNNHAIKGVLEARPLRKHIITTAVEHPSVLNLCKDLKRRGYDVTYLKVNNEGELDPVELIDALRDDTAIVSIMYANNETGVVFPIEKFSKIVKKTDPQIVFHTDATQVMGKIAVTAQTLEYIDLLSFSGHKMYAPKGVGALYKKSRLNCRPLIIGGHQEKGLRAGTENLAYIVAMAKACEMLAAEKQEFYEGFTEAPLESRLRDRLERFVQNNIKGTKINGFKANRLGNTSSISFLGIEGEGLIYALNDEGILCSTGSACSSGDLESSHVLKAMGIPFEYAHGTLRFSFGRFNTENDVQKVEEFLPKIVSNLRKISPFWDNEKDEFKNDPIS